MEDFVPFLLAKKLKEKGFREKCFAYYMPNNTTVVYNHNQWMGGIVEDCLYSYNSYNKDMLNNDFIDAPTISQVLKWLRKKDIMVEIPIDLRDDGTWRFTFRIQTKEFYERAIKEDYSSYEEAVMACLECILII